MMSNFSGWGYLLAFAFYALYAGLIALGFWLLYQIVFRAVRRALREHQAWLEGRGSPQA